MQSRKTVKRHWRLRLHDIVFENDTPAGKAFDIALLVSILLSVLTVLLESVASIRQTYGGVLRVVEWTFTVLFTAEYILRLACISRPARYAFSFFGLVDLLAIVPTYMSLVLPGTQTLLVIRALRLLRVFRVLKMGHYIGAARSLGAALRASRQKITVFLTSVLTIVIIVGALMYLIEGEANGFTSIPASIYWAIVTMTTVGYGDIAPKTVLGQLLASALMITGYAVIAVPTGIITVELAQATRQGMISTACSGCGRQGHDSDARHCKYCGALLETGPVSTPTAAQTR
jgi:voltage-gated potassium channel